MKKAICISTITAFIVFSCLVAVWAKSYDEKVGNKSNVALTNMNTSVRLMQSQIRK